MKPEALHLWRGPRWALALLLAGLSMSARSRSSPALASAALWGIGVLAWPLAPRH